jgi:putative ABC transport system permease protein
MLFNLFQAPLRPMLRSLAHHRVVAALIVLEVALSFAIVANAMHLIQRLWIDLNLSTGLPEAELMVAEPRAMKTVEEALALSTEDMRRIRALPGVHSAAVVNQVVFGNSSNNSGVNTAPNSGGKRVIAARYEGDEHFIPTLGLRLVDGRNFKPDEVKTGEEVRNQSSNAAPPVIINRALAEALFPGKSAVGQAVYWGSSPPITVVGVVDVLTHTNPKQSDSPYAMIVPVKLSYRDGTYMLRVEPAKQGAVAKALTQLIPEVDSRRWLVRTQLLSDMRKDYFAQDRAMVGLLAGVSVALLLVTAFGIVGLASFWVEQRRRMIGVRRALGATQAQIRQYFQAENALLTGMGVVVGAVVAMALSQWMAVDKMPLLPWPYLLGGALLLLALGQLAVLAPARRAATLAPASVMRS